MSAGVLIAFDEGEVHVPPEATASLAAFRRWALSEECPDYGRVDFIDGRIEINDMAGEELFSHGALKAKLCAAILGRVEQLDLG